MCGIAAVYAPGLDVARQVYFGLYALQHRGQESAGIAVGDGTTLKSHREMGLLTGVFNEEILGRLTGFAGIGHTRYSTTGSSIVCNAQPFMEETDIGPFAFGHNGNLTNSEALLAALPEGIELDATSDSEILAKTIARGSGSTLVERVKQAMAVAEGAYSIVMCTPDAIIAFRDPWGVRPLSIGTYPGGGYMIDMARYEMGRALALEHPIDADVVMAVPDSAIPGGIGYAAQSGLPYVEGLIKNRYIGRTFISPDQTLRAQGVQLKFNPIVENLRGQRVVVVDDSIVRGTTTPRIVKLLRDAGAKEVHLRITSPPIMHPCYLGVDMATYDELIAANLTVPQICERVGADSLGYLSVEHLVASTGRARNDFCLGCLTGAYPAEPVMAAPDGDRQPALKA